MIQKLNAQHYVAVWRRECFERSTDIMKTKDMMLTSGLLSLNTICGLQTSHGID